VERVFFAFEQDFVTDLRCIPMAVRYKLDRAGLKVPLPQWQSLSPPQRQHLWAQPCDTPEEVAQFARQLISLIAEPLAPIAEPPLWEATEPPEGLRSRCAQWGADLSGERWQALSALQRYALYKLSRSHHAHEHRNLPIALREFGLIAIPDEP
jgi:hypothetical protein